MLPAIQGQKIGGFKKTDNKKHRLQAVFEEIT
jgi:hypothetical protein